MVKGESARKRKWPALRLWRLANGSRVRSAPIRVLEICLVGGPQRVQLAIRIKFEDLELPGENVAVLTPEPS